MIHNTTVFQRMTRLTRGLPCLLLASLVGISYASQSNNTSGAAGAYVPYGGIVSHVDDAQQKKTTEDRKSKLDLLQNMSRYYKQIDVYIQAGVQASGKQDDAEVDAALVTIHRMLAHWTSLVAGSTGNAAAVRGQSPYPPTQSTGGYN